MSSRLSKFLLAAACLTFLAGGFHRAQAGVSCIEAVFFDLGNTLVENPGDGIFVLRPGAADAISDLQAAGVRLGIITNVPGGWDLDDLRALLAEPEFLDEFEVVILSSQAPASKPDPAIYLFAHEALATPRPPITSCAFVGETLGEIADREIDPTEGARSVGMVGIHLSDGAPSPLTDYTIPTDGLDEVLTIVEDTCSSANVEETPVEPASRLLHGSRPNPSSGDSRISYTVPKAGHVVIGIYDTMGRRVDILVDETVSAGSHTATWDGTGSGGRAVPTGVYYAKMFVGDHREQVTVLRVR